MKNSLASVNPSSLSVFNFQSQTVRGGTWCGSIATVLATDILDVVARIS